MYACQQRICSESKPQGAVTFRYIFPAHMRKLESGDTFCFTIKYAENHSHVICLMSVILRTTKSSKPTLEFFTHLLLEQKQNKIKKMF